MSVFCPACGSEMRRRAPVGDGPLASFACPNGCAWDSRTIPRVVRPVVLDPVAAILPRAPYDPAIVDEAWHRPVSAL